MNIEVTKLSDLDRLRDDELVAFLRGREVNTISSEGNRRRLLNLAKFYFRFLPPFFGNISYGGCLLPRLTLHYRSFGWEKQNRDPSFKGM